MHPAKARFSIACNPGRVEGYSVLLIAVIWQLGMVIFHTCFLAATARAEQSIQFVSRDRRAIAAETAVAEAERMHDQWTTKSLLRAIKKYEEARLLWQSLQDRQKEARALKGMGDVYRILGQNRRALNYYKNALALSKLCDARNLEIDLINDISSIEIDLGERQKVIDDCNESLRLCEQTGYLRGQAQALNNMGLAYYYLREMGRTLDLFKQAIALWKTTDDFRGQAEALTNLGYAYSDLGEIHKAMDCFNESLTLWRRAGDRRGLALTLAIIGFENTWKGEAQKSLAAYKEAGDIFRAIGDRNGEALILTGSGYLYFVLGEMQKALSSYKQALHLHKLLSNPARQAIAMGHIGAIYDSLGDKQKALYYLESKLRIDLSLKDPRLTAYTFRETGSVYDSLGKIKKAFDYYNRSLSLSRAASDPRGQARALNSIGYLHHRAGEANKALQYFDQALLLLRSAEDKTEEILTLHNIARAKTNLGDLDGAASHANAMIEMIESVRARVNSPELRASYFASAHQHYHLIVDILMLMHDRNPSAGYDALAFEMSERGRARSLLEMLNESSIDIREGADPVLLLRERELKQLLDAKSARQVELLNNRQTEHLAAAIRKELTDLANEYQDVRAQIKATSFRYAALTQPQTLTALEIQQQVLDPDSLLLEYSLGEERSYLWAITTSSIKSYRIAGRDEIEKTARRMIELLAVFQSKDGVGMSLDAIESQYEREAERLGQMLLAPIADEINNKRLLIVADSALQYIPFSALPSPCKKTGYEPLIADHEVVNLPSASTITTLRRQTAGRAPAELEVAIFADPVFEKQDPRIKLLGQDKPSTETVAAAHQRAAPLKRFIRNFRSESDPVTFPRLLATRREAKMIMAHTKNGKSMQATDFSANRAVATSAEMAQYGIIHFATHGLLDSEHPELSAIVLSLVDEQGKPRNGFLRLYDLYNLNLPADLVVLSACNTALGKNIRGEGLVGITRGFMYAGAARIVASLWKVDDDATAELMGCFYRNMLKDRVRPAAALRAAQVEIYNRSQWRSPIYWAAFVFQGEWR